MFHSLSAELTDLIIDAVDNSDCDSLRQFSLVSRTWRPRSQYKLFSRTVNLIHPDARMPCGRNWKGSRNHLLNYALEFLHIANVSCTIASAVQGLIIPHIAFDHTLPFEHLQSLEIVLIAEDGSRNTLLRDMNHVELDPRGRLVRSVFAGTFPPTLVQQNLHLQKLVLTNMVIDEELMLSVFQALGADKGEASLSHLTLNRCTFAPPPTSLLAVRRGEPHQVKFRDLSLVIGEVENIDIFLNSFYVQGLRSLFFATDGNALDACADVINKYHSQIQRLTFKNLPCCVGSGFEDIQYEKLHSLKEVYIASTYFHHYLSSDDSACQMIKKIAETPDVHLQVLGLPANSILSNSAARIDDLLANLALAKPNSLKEIMFWWEEDRELSNGRPIGEKLPRAAKTEMLMMVSGENVDGFTLPGLTTLRWF
ncbi:hypothetical protein K435DRAFT_801669 [Dendrothele bispora CBS 962.96]|uniref:F-box domain-containing protein n=1 Tax=Dendrothele bispora (strain CBS 962.96) TaxID=1314807 RepID=A0A4S8LNF5_DENBC|nr:hypothetical protein K435DRAFT_801669 [Dendrothele bispora CBS 962.96]